MELQDATKLSLAIMPNHDQAAVIKGKLEAINRGDDTVEVSADERDSLKKYSLFETVKLLHPENAQDIVLAKKVKCPNQLMTKLL
jgi:hypothetical protein